MSVTVRVLPPFRIHYRGTVYAAGETVEVSDAAANGWRDWGPVEHVETKKTEKTTTRKSG